MRIARGLTCVAIAGLGLGVLVTPASAAQAENAENYVALGDSYSSGVGVGDYGDSGDCKRSAHAYPQLWADGHDVAGFDFVACSGAKTGDVLEDQVSALGEDTSLVTISVGGNDTGFSDVMVSCNTGSDDACVERVEEAKTVARQELPGKLDSVYGEIAERAPSAEVIVLGYPRMYELNGSCDAGLSETKREAINGGADTLNEVTAERASAAGVRFVDVRPAFTGHEICSDDWWLKSVSYPVDESYHPNAAGQQGGYHDPLTEVTG
ncbi:MAG: lipase [Pseudonocardiaceae bacterium]|nr:lipase [Pseudonocardiaceae bacterium]